MARSLGLKPQTNVKNKTGGTPLRGGRRTAKIKNFFTSAAQTSKTNCFATRSYVLPPKLRMNTTRSNISPSGTIKNLLHLGFTSQDALNELIDNSLDSGATHVRIRFDTTSNTLYVDDDGNGMDRDQLTKALCIYDARPVSENIGLRGAGLKAAHCVLSNEEFPTIIISKTSTSPRCEIDADWPGAITRDYWDPRASRGSDEYRPIWERGCINPDHGTTTKIPMTAAKFSEFLYTLPVTLKDIGRTYEKYINVGKRITIEVDGAVHTPDMSTSLSWEGTSAHLRNEVPITILHNPTTGEKRVYYQHVHRRPDWTDMVRDNPDKTVTPKILRDFNTAQEDGFIVLAEMTLRSTYSSEWNPPPNADGEREMYIPGYVSPCRDRRYLRAMPTEFGHAGDYENRRVWASSRHALEFAHTADALIGIQVNKSNLTPENIDPLLLATVYSLAKSWATKIYTKYFKIAQNNPNAEFERRLNRAVKQLKEAAKASNREIFFEVFEEMMEDLEFRLDEYEPNDQQ